METQKGAYKDYSPFKGGAIWVSMLVWGSVGIPCCRTLGLLSSEDKAKNPDADCSPQVQPIWNLNSKPKA